MSKHRKERITFSLSADTTAFLRKFRKREDAPSLSAVLEKMVENFKRSQELVELNASVSAYYDSLPETEMQDQLEWAKLGRAGMAAFESETEAKEAELVHQR